MRKSDSPPRVRGVPAEREAPHRAVPKGENRPKRLGKLQRGWQILRGVLDAVDMTVGLIFAFFVVLGLWWEQWAASPLVAIIAFLLVARWLARRAREARWEKDGDLSD